LLIVALLVIGLALGRGVLQHLEQAIAHLAIGKDLGAHVSIDAESLRQILDVLLLVFLMKLRHLLKGCLFVEADDLIAIQNLLFVKVMSQDLCGLLGLHPHDGTITFLLVIQSC
jgi:hypothetical protein